ncbi:FecR family protein [Aliarcobacter lanthieri]|uniref:FecR family protein n=1 Tax=Aliarcobacter lanthieri TaxID=1355374 RepID=UPI003AAFAF29
MSNRSIQDAELINQIKALPKDFLDELKNEVKQNRLKINKRKRFLKVFSPLAAACILAVLYVSIFIEFPNYSQKYQTLTKIQNNIILPDNSKISLDSNTSIEVKYYKSKRVVDLSNGKAIFDVTSNKEQPFIIHTNKINIEVVGTKFEVVNNQNELQVNVLEGSVKVSRAEGYDIQLALVTKGQSLKLDQNANKISQKDENINQMLQWSEGKVSFNQTNLNDVFDEFSKYLDIQITFEKERAKRYPISGTFDVKYFDDFIKVLPAIHPIKVVRKDNTIIIK